MGGVEVVDAAVGEGGEVERGYVVEEGCVWEGAG